MGVKAAFSYKVVPGPNPSARRVVAIIDEFDPAAPTMTVTNDAEAVIDQLVRIGVIQDRDRIIYRDTEGFWDEIVRLPDRPEVDFAPIRVRDRDAAVAIVRRR